MEKVYTIDDLMQAIKESGRSYDTDRIMAAYQVAKEAHKDQRRRSGEPYISHPVAVAIILVGLGMDTETLVAALLHDVVEDTATTGESIEKQFGEDVALMVNGVTKLGQVPFFHPGGAAGGKCPQNAACHGTGCPGYHHQAGGPSAQYAHPGIDAAPEAAG